MGFYFFSPLLIHKLFTIKQTKLNNYVLRKFIMLKDKEKLTTKRGGKSEYTALEERRITAQIT